MQGGEDEHRAGDGVPPAAPTGTEPASTGVFDVPPLQAPVDAPGDGRPAEPTGPILPSSEARPPVPMVDPVTQPRPGAATWYRSDEERARSVYRRANPWYRRLARGVIGMAFLGIAAIGAYAGARAIQSYLERDRLPSAGAEVPEIRATSFLVTSSAPAPEVDGTLTLDTATSAFEFVGRAGGPQDGLQVVSPDGATVYVRQGASAWRAAGDDDAAAAPVRTAARYLADDDNADDILTNRLRRGFVDLVDQTDEGTGPGRLTRYEMSFDTAAFSRDFPLQWQEYQDEAVPGAAEGAAVPVTIWLDDEDVLMRVTDQQSNWAWERLTYTDQPFRPVDPASDTRVVQVACVSDDDTVFWQTPFPSCDEALTAARSAAADAGLGAAFGDLDRTVARVCSAMEGTDEPGTVTADEAALAGALVSAGVCRGDPGALATG